MGILNITPDSFFDGGKYAETSAMLKHAEKMLADGASILDIGACSTRPGADEIPVEEESQRLITALRALKKEFPDAILSADTYRSGVAEKAVEAGADIINDISGGTMDQRMFEAVARLRVPYILMHIKGTPKDMQQDPSYNDVAEEVIKYFTEKIEVLKKLGIKDIIIDPGFGFGKNLKHNYTLLKKLPLLDIFEVPVLAGVSRKSMVNKVIKSNPSTALNGTTVVNTIALMNGANILRVHDVKEAVEAVKIFSYYNSLE